MTEPEFIQSIDCAFPYHDSARALSLIGHGCTISTNAGFMVMHELARVPTSESVDKVQLLGLMKQLRDRLPHPLTELVASLAEQMIAGRCVPVSEATTTMRTIAAFRGQHAALSIAYFSCDDKDGLADALYEEIIRSWKAPD